MNLLNKLLNWLLDCISRSVCVEFDYTDATGEHHGRCDIRTLWVSEQRIEHQLHFWGYRNIHIVR